MPIATRPSDNVTGGEGYSTTVGGKLFRHERTTQIEESTGYRIPQLTPMELTKLLNLLEDKAIDIEEGESVEIDITNEAKGDSNVKVGWVYLPKEVLPKEGCRIKTITLYSSSRPTKNMYLNVFASDSNSLDPSEANASYIGTSASTQVATYDSALSLYKLEFSFSPAIVVRETGLRFYFDDSRVLTWPNNNPSYLDCVLNLKSFNNTYYVAGGCMCGIKSNNSVQKYDEIPKVTFACISSTDLTQNTYRHIDESADETTLEATNILIDRAFIPNTPFCYLAFSANPAAIGKTGKIRCVLTTQTVEGGTVQQYDTASNYQKFWEDAVISTPVVSKNYVDLSTAEGCVWWGFHFEAITIPENTPLRVTFIESDTEEAPSLVPGDVRQLHRKPSIPVTVNRNSSGTYPGFTVYADGGSDIQLSSSTTPFLLFSVYSSAHASASVEPWSEKETPLSKEESGMEMVFDLKQATNTLNLADIFGRNVYEDTGITTYATIDWGDGSAKLEINGNERSQGKSISHTYADKGEHTVTVAGIVYWGSGIKGSTPSPEQETWRLYLKEIRIPGAARSPIRGANGRQMFYQCAELTSIPANLFADCSGITSLELAFCGTSITEIPKGLFGTCTEVTSFHQCFRNCAALKTVPYGLFAQSKKCTNFYGLFDGCTMLESVPIDLFKACPDVVSDGIEFPDAYKNGGFNNLFRGCKHLTKVPSNLFKHNTKVTQFCGVFSGSGLTAIPEGLFDSNTAAESFYQCFYSCEDLVEVPSTLFDKTTNANDFYECFRYDSSVFTTLPETWKLYQQATHDNCYCGCESAYNYDDAVNAGWACPRDPIHGLQLHITTTEANQVIDLGYVLGQYKADSNTVAINGVLDWGEELRPATVVVRGHEGTGEGSRLRHVYEFPGSYDITIAGVFTWDGSMLQASGLTNTLTSITLDDEAETCPIYHTRQTFLDCAVLQTVTPRFFENCGSVTDMSYALSGCTSFEPEQWVGETPFASLTNVTSFDHCFDRTPIKIPVRLFSTCTNATSFEWCFADVSCEQEIPADLFTANTLVQSFSGCFNGGKFTSIPENLFATCVDATDFSMCFEGCPITEIPRNILEHNVKASNLDYMFAGIEVPHGTVLPGLWKTHATASHENCFNKCQKAANYAAARYVGWTDISESRGDFLQLRVNVEASTEIDLSSSFTHDSNAFTERSCVYVDWDDGGTLVDSITDGDAYCRHTYDNAGTYSITVGALLQLPEENRYGEGVQLKSDSDPGMLSVLQYLEAIEVPALADGSPISDVKPSAGDSVFGIFADVTTLVEISGNIFEQAHLALGTSLDNMFLRCTRLTSIPSNLFSAFGDSATSVNSTFEGCTSLTKIDEKLFKGFTKLQEARHTFKESGVGYVPGGLFSDAANLQSVEGCFQNCASLTEVTPELFDPETHTKLTAFNDCFLDCVNVDGELPTWWDEFPEADGTNCFTNDNQTSNYDIAVDNAWAGVYAFSSNILTFFIDQTKSDPEELISYSGREVELSPMRMEYDSLTHKGTMNWGNWKDSHWLLQKFRPCMLKKDGIVDYFLNRNDFTKKESGEDSDYNNVSYEGNAMIQVGQIWIKEEVTDDDHIQVSLAPRQIDDTYDCWTHYNVLNELVDNIYLPMYRLSRPSGGVRSISGQAIYTHITSAQFRAACKAVGYGYDTFTWSFQRMMLYVLMMLFKTTDMQKACGQGVVNMSSALAAGGQEADGMFSGYDDGTHHVVALGIEDFWGNVRNLITGFVTQAGKAYLKMTPGTADGSSGSDYSERIADFKQNVACAAKGNLRKMLPVSGFGLVPSTAGGSTTLLQGYTDYVAMASATTVNAVWGGGQYSGGTDGGPGPFGYAHAAASVAEDNRGAMLTYTPADAKLPEDSGILKLTI